MPLFKKIALNDSVVVWVWKITETYEELLQSVVLKESSLARLSNMKSDDHRKGFLGVRRLLMEAGYTDEDLYYDEFGKPHLSECSRQQGPNNPQNPDQMGCSAIGNSQPEIHISISHSHDFSVIALSDSVIGIDLEKLKDKTLKLAPRYMDVSHLENLPEAEQLKKATVIWGVKESVFKIKNEKGISFLDHIFENDFNLNDKKCLVELRFNDKAESFEILFDFIEDYVLVCALEKK